MMESPPLAHNNIPFEKVTKVPVERLALDSENPRLLPADSKANEVEVVGHLYRSEDLGELLDSMAANGYLDIEPLIVLAEGQDLTVLEGNRRLAAILLFEKPNLAEQIFREEGLRISVPSFPDEFRNTLQKVSVYRVKSRADARSFIGFKHINGAARWQSYAKARFAAKWYREGGTSLQEIANKIGDRHDTIKRMVNAIYVLEQAEETGIFDLSDRASPRFNFSHLYTALARPPFMHFLGLGEAWSGFNPKPDPVTPTKLDNLREVLRWLYGSKKDGIDATILSQNPDIRHLGEVLESPEGLYILRTTHSLTEAHLSTGPANKRFSDSLIRARSELRNASNNLRGFDGQDRALCNIAEDISETAQAMFERMVKKMRDVETEAK